MVAPNKAISAILPFFQVPKASVNGALEPLPSAFIFWQTGDSFILRRIQTETPSRMQETRNGTRQPQAANASLPRKACTASTTISDRNSPSVAVVWIQAV